MLELLEEFLQHYLKVLSYWNLNDRLIAGEVRGEEA